MVLISPDYAAELHPIRLHLSVTQTPSPGRLISEVQVVTVDFLVVPQFS